ncbi:hypothetical protein TH606_02915 [Thermodesulfatator autotrophicus]|uniref:Uncharacterized protein n=1 Tax=Thermodesulfatator autotrophicus TaxID=1795632 RepID=A0A177E8U7_9BACT|nr:hypothetical protein TH606_02915 [Thermodesulfatator autotrophicus]
MLLLLYQAFGKVARDFLYLQEGKHFSIFIKASEGLRRQLENIDKSKVNVAGRPGSLFYWRNGLLVFLTRFGPGGKTIVMYKNTKGGLVYAELLYTGQRLSSNLFDEVKKLPNPSIFFVPGANIALLKAKNEDEFKELSSWRGIPSCQDKVFIKFSSGSLARFIPICP